MLRTCSARLQWQMTGVDFLATATTEADRHLHEIESAHWFPTVRPEDSQPPTSSCQESWTQFFPAMPPGLVTGTSPGAFHDFPPFHITPQNCSMSRMEGVFPEPRVQPNHTQLPTLCATRTEDLVCILTHAQSVSLCETSPPTERPGIFRPPSMQRSHLFS